MISVTEAGTSANNLQKIADIQLPEPETHVQGYVLTSPVAAAAQIILLIDTGDALGTLKSFPQVNIIGVEQIDPTESTQIFFPWDYGFKLNTGDHIGVYSFATAGGVSFTSYVTVYWRPFSNVPTA